MSRTVGTGVPHEVGASAALDPGASLWAAPGVVAWPDADLVAATGCLQVTVGRQFAGPPGVGNGGWVAGTAAALLPPSVAGANPVEVTLSSPTPVDTVLHAEWEPRRARLYGASVVGKRGAVLVEARPAVGRPLAPPPFVPLEHARRAEERFLGRTSHPFPGCLVCGPDRAPGEGMRIFPGPVEERAPSGRPGDEQLFASTWTVPALVAGPGGRVPATAVWAALDCSTAWPHFGVGTVALLGRLTAAVAGEVEVGATYVVVSRRAGAQGRKAFGEAAVYDRDGGLVGSSRGVWISVG